MTSIAVNGLSLDKHVNTIYADIEGLKQTTSRLESQAAQTEPPEHMVDSIFQKIMVELEKKRILSVVSDLNAFKEKYGRDVLEARESQAIAIKHAENRLDRRIDELNETINEKIDKKFDKVEHQIMLINEKLEELEIMNNRTGDMIVDLRIENKKQYELTIKIVDEKSFDVLQEAKAKISDTFHSCDGRIRTLEENLNLEMTRTTEGFDKFTNHLVDADSQIKKLFDECATKEDVMQKADAAELQRKADYVDLSTTNDSLSDLSRRMDFFSSNVSDQLKNLERESDAKLESKARYIIEMVRKEREVGGTDIGKIKCLVCDQPIRQKEEANEFQMSAMANTVGTKRRSASPPRESERRAREEGVQVREEEQYYHKSLASMGALPVHDALNSVIQKYAEEQRAVTAAIVEANEEYKRGNDYEGQQRHRADSPLSLSATELQVPATTNFPPPPKSKLFEQTHGFEMKHGGSFANPRTTKGGYANQTGGPPPTSKDYFQHLEMKFASTGSTGRSLSRPGTATNRSKNPLLAASAKDNAISRRPGSAIR